ncbi:MAG: glycosyltransferase [Bacteroidota bacterium]
MISGSVKKIVILGSAHPLRGGLATYNERLARAYMEQGCDVTIYNFKLQYPSFLFPGKSQYSDSPAPEKLTIKTVVNSINPFNWCKIGRELRKLNPDLIIVKYWLPFIGPCFGTILRKAKKNKHTKVISILDNIIPHEKRFGDRMFTKYFIKPVDGFVAMSESVIKDLDTFDTVKPRVFCPHPLYDNFGAVMPRNEALEKLKLDPAFRYLLFFGFIRDYKGLDILLKAFADSSVEKLPLRLLVAGEFYSDPKPYHELIQTLHLKDRVDLFTDFIPDDQVPLFFSACDLVIQPYKHATQSGVTQIAYHFGKPMVVTDVGGLAEIVPHGKAGYVVNPEPSAIAEAIVDFFANHKMEVLTAGVEEEKKKYAWENMTAALNSVLSQVVAIN